MILGVINSVWIVMLILKNEMHILYMVHKIRNYHIRYVDGSLTITSFFFSNFPEKCWARDMYEVFSKHGRVKEVVIPARRNGMGKIFGFARFYDIKEPERMVVILDNIFVKGEKLHVNLPRFQRVQIQDPRPMLLCLRVHQ